MCSFEVLLFVLFFSFLLFLEMGGVVVFCCFLNNNLGALILGMTYTVVKLIQSEALNILSFKQKSCSAELYRKPWKNSFNKTVHDECVLYWSSG